MQIKKVNNIVAGTLLLSSMLALSQCGNNTRTLRNIAKENGYTKSEIKEILYDTRNTSPMYQNAERQAVIDFIAYRNLLNNTEFANNSYAISQLKSTSEKLRIADDINGAADEFIKINELEGADKNELNLLKAEVKKDARKWMLPRKVGSYRQFKYDKYFYKKFFEELGLMDNKSFRDSFEKTSKKIKP